MLKEVRRVNQQFLGECKLLEIFQSKLKAEEVALHVPRHQHLKRCQEVSEALRQLAELWSRSK